MSDPDEANRPSELIIWGRTTAINVPKVVWAADEVGIPYRRIDAGYGFGVVDTPDFLRMNPNGRVPTIDDDGFVLWESHAIVRYLCARYGSGDVYPADLCLRMSAERWMDWQATDVFTAYRPAYNVLRRGGDLFTREQAEAALARTLGLLGILDRRLAESRFVAADHFTIGDIPLGIQVHDVMRLGREVPGLENMKRWYRSLCARPGAQTAMAMIPALESTAAASAPAGLAAGN